jgi:hypothetical protein
MSVLLNRICIVLPRSALRRDAISGLLFPRNMRRPLRNSAVTHYIYFISFLALLDKTFSATFLLLLFLKYFLANASISISSIHKQCILSHLYTTALLCFPKKPYALAGFEPGSSIVFDVHCATPPGAQCLFFVSFRRMFFPPFLTLSQDPIIHEKGLGLIKKILSHLGIKNLFWVNRSLNKLINSDMF